MKRLQLLTLAAFLSVSAHALTLDHNNPNCRFQVYKGGKWQLVPAAEVPTDSFTAKTPSKSEPNVSVAKIAGTWYSFQNDCALSDGAGGGPVDAPVAHRGSEGDEERSWFVEATVFYGAPSGDGVKGGTVTSGSVTETVGAYSAKIAYGGRIGFRLSPDNTLGVTIERLSGSQDGTITASGVNGVIQTTDAYNNVGLFYRRMIRETNTFTGFLDVGAGLSLASSAMDLSNFTGAVASLNGHIEASAKPFWFGTRVGGVFKLSSWLSVLPYLGYEHVFLNSATVDSSTSSLYTAGNTVSSSSVSWWTVGVSLLF